MIYVSSIDRHTLQKNGDTYVFKPVSVPETRGSTGAGRSTARIDASRDLEVVCEPEVHGTRDRCPDTRVSAKVQRVFEPAMPGGGERVLSE
jgi:hypothetical protein